MYWSILIIELISKKSIGWNKRHIELNWIELNWIELIIHRGLSLIAYRFWISSWRYWSTHSLRIHWRRKMKRKTALVWPSPSSNALQYLYSVVVARNSADQAKLESRGRKMMLWSRQRARTVQTIQGKLVSPNSWLLMKMTGSHRSVWIMEGNITKVSIY